jgi:hypothetical protein
MKAALQRDRKQYSESDKNPDRRKGNGLEFNQGYFGNEKGGRPDENGYKKCYVIFCILS